MMLKIGALVFELNLPRYVFKTMNVGLIRDLVLQSQNRPEPFSGGGHRERKQSNPFAAGKQQSRQNDRKQQAATD